MATEVTPPDVEPAKKQKPITQSERILLQLRDAGKRGVPNYKLAEYNLGYRGRITELRHDGYDIYCQRQTVNGKASGIWRYYLREGDDE